MVLAAKRPATNRIKLQHFVIFYLYATEKTIAIKTSQFATNFSFLGSLPDAHIQLMESGVLSRFLHCRGSGRRKGGGGDGFLIRVSGWEYTMGWIKCGYVLCWKYCIYTLYVSIVVDTSCRTHSEICCSSSHLAFDIRLKHKELILIDHLSPASKKSHHSGHLVAFRSMYWKGVDA